MVSGFLTLLLATLMGMPAVDEPTTYTLDNGLLVRLAPLQGEKRVSLILAVRAGFFSEPAGFPHLAHVTEHLVVFGLPAESEEKQATERWFHEGHANGETLPGWMYFDLHVDSAELDTALRVQAIRLSHPVFTPELLAREIPRTLAELEHVEKSEEFGTGKFATSAFVQAALHGQVDVPIKEKTRTISVEDVQRFNAVTFRPDQAVLCIVGNFDPVQTCKRIEKFFGMIRKPKDAFVSPQLRQDKKQLTAHWDASTRHLFLAWSTLPASSPEHAALSVAADLLTTHLSVDRDLSRWAKMPLATCDVEGMFLVSIQVKKGVDIEEVRDKLLNLVAQLSKVYGTSDIKVAMIRQRITQSLHPGGLSRFFSGLRGSQLIDRTNEELQRISKVFAYGDLKAYSDRVEAVSGRGVREAVGHHLTPQKAVVVRVEPSN